MSKEEKIIYRVEFQSSSLEENLKKINAQTVKLKKSNQDLKKSNQETSDQFVNQKQKIKELSAEYRVVSQAMSNTHKLRKAEKGSLEELKAKLSLVTAQINKMNKAEREGTKEGKKLIAIQKQLNDELKRTETRGGSFFRNVGNYPKILKNLATGLGNVWNHFKILFGITALITLFKNLFNTIKDFEQGSATLAAVLGETKAEIKDLTDLARELGATTQYTATQVLTLAEALARLGFSKQEIKEMSKSVLDLATALNTDLSSAATLAGSTIRAFEFDTSDSQHVMDVLAKSTTESSLSFEKLSTALPIVGTTAHNAGVSFEKLVATLGTLTDRGIDASTAGTSLRKVYLQLSKSGLSMTEAFDKIEKSTDKNKTSMELFGVRAATAGVILAGATDKVDEFTEALENADGTTKKMADEQLDTLQGSLLLLKSAWDGLILSMNESTGVGDKLKVFFKWLAENLKDIVKWVGILAVGFVTYKTALIGMTLATQIYTTVTKFAKAATIGFNTALKATPWGAIIAGIAMLVTYLLTLRKSQEDVIDVNKRFNDSFVEGKTHLDALFNVLKNSNSTYAEREKAIKQINEEYGEYLPHLITEKTSLEDIEIAQKAATDALYANIVAQVKLETQTELLKKKMNLLVGAINELDTADPQSFRELTEELSTLTKRERELRLETIEASKGQDKFYNIVKSKKSLLLETASAISGVNKELKDSDKILNALLTGGNVNPNAGDGGNEDDNKKKYKVSNFDYEQSKIELEQFRNLYHEELKKTTALNQEETDTKLQILKDELVEEINVLDEKHELDKKNLDRKLYDETISYTEYQKQLILIDEKYQIEKDKITFKNEDKVKETYDKLKAYKLKDIEIKADLDKKYALVKLKQGEIDRTKYSEELKEIELRVLREKISQELVDEAQKQIILQQIREKALELETLKAFNEQQHKYKLLLKNGEISQAKYNQKMFDLEVVYLKKSTTYALASEKEKQKMVDSLRKKWITDSADTILGATKEQHKQKLQEIYTALLSLAQEYINSLAQMKYDADQREIDSMIEQNDKILQQMDDRHDKELRALEYRYNSGEITEQQYLKNKLKLEDNYVDSSVSIQERQAQEEKRLKSDQLEEQKKYQRASVYINAASAIISAWANTIPYPAGAIYAGIQSAIIGASAAIQIQTINSQHLAEGGILNGPLHAQGGIGGNTVEGGEYMINRASTQTYKPVLDYINSQGNGTNNTADMKSIIDYDLFANKLGSVINNKKVILTQNDLVEDENSRVMIEQNSTF